MTEQAALGQETCEQPPVPLGIGGGLDQAVDGVNAVRNGIAQSPRMRPKPAAGCLVLVAQVRRCLWIGHA
ncbi:hypothetical protein D3C72_2269480 [compost metagenome]